MSETLSYQEPAPTELNEAEQEALEVGEQMEADQNQLLAGKYKSAGDLEKAYLELQQKLGSQTSSEEDEVSEPEPESPEEGAKESEPDKSEPQSLTQQDVDYLHGLAGGADGYKEMISWASENMDANEIKMYDRVMDQGDPAAILFAVKSLVSQYKDATGSEGQLLTGKSAPNSANRGFRSQAELIAAMNDPRYDSDDAYRSDIIKKLENSNIDF